jgi:nitroreductase
MRARGRLDSHRQIGLFLGFGFFPFRGRVYVPPAVQNLLLAARALGIGGTITSLHPNVDDRVHALFGIPNTAQIVYCIPLGYPKGNFGPNRRKPLPEVCSFDRWDTPSPWQG